MVTEMRTTRVHRTWLDKLLLWQRAYETRIFDGHHDVVGRGPTAEASQVAAERRWVAELPTEDKESVRRPQPTPGTIPAKS
jgi:hypothetical protein